MTTDGAAAPTSLSTSTACAIFRIAEPAENTLRFGPSPRVGNIPARMNCAINNNLYERVRQERDQCSSTRHGGLDSTVVFFF